MAREAAPESCRRPSTPETTAPPTNRQEARTIAYLAQRARCHLKTDEKDPAFHSIAGHQCGRERARCPTRRCSRFCGLHTNFRLMRALQLPPSTLVGGLDRRECISSPERNDAFFACRRRRRAAVRVGIEDIRARRLTLLPRLKPIADLCHSNSVLGSEFAAPPQRGMCAGGRQDLPAVSSAPSS